MGTHTYFLLRHTISLRLSLGKLTDIGKKLLNSNAPEYLVILLLKIKEMILSIFHFLTFNLIL